MKTLANTTAAFVLGAAAIAAIPATAQEAPSVTVSFADLNLSSARGTAIFDRRIKNAIANVCGGVAPRDVGARRIYNRCLEETALAVEPKRDLAVAEYRSGQLAAKTRVIRFAAQ
jgi:UrcA family protein